MSIRNKVWGVAGIAGALVVSVRSPIVLLAAAILAYMNTERVFEVKPLAMHELGQVLSGQPEATLALMGVVVAFASARAFLRVKRLDLELELAAQINELLDDSIVMGSRHRWFCNEINKVRSLHAELISLEPGSDASLALANELRFTWEVMIEDVPQLRADHEGIWKLDSRLRRIVLRHGAVVRSRPLLYFALYAANENLQKMAAVIWYRLPFHEESLESYLTLLPSYKGPSPADYLASADKHGARYIEWMGMAGAVGNSSVTRPSLIAAVHQGWKLWRTS